MLFLLRRRIGSFGGRELLSVFARTAVAAALMGLAAWLAYGWSAPWLGSKLGLLAAMGLALPAYYAFCRIFRIREIGQIARALTEKIKR